MKQFQKIFMLCYHTSMSTYFLWMLPLLHDRDKSFKRILERKKQKKKPKHIEPIPRKGLLVKANFIIHCHKLSVQKIYYSGTSL